MNNISVQYVIAFMPIPMCFHSMPSFCTLFHIQICRFVSIIQPMRERKKFNFFVSTTDNTSNIAKSCINMRDTKNMQRTNEKNAQKFQRLTRPLAFVLVLCVRDSIVLICKQPHIAPHHQLTTHIRTLNSIYYSMFHCLSSVSFSVVDTFDAPVIISHCRLRVWPASARAQAQTQTHT